MPNYQCNILVSNPGIQRDGTPLASNSFIAGSWTRFYLNQPRSVGGYNCVYYGNINIIRSMFSIPQQQVINLYLGRKASVGYIALPTDDNITVSSVIEIDRTPTETDLPFVPNPEFLWDFDLYTTYSAMYPNPQIIAMVAPNANSINNNIAGSIYYGDITNNDPLTRIIDPNININIAPPPTNFGVTCSGGIVFISPIIVAYGSNGQIYWNNPFAEDPLNTWSVEDPTTHDWIPLTAIIANTKLVYGTPQPGADVPTGLFWSLNSISRISYTPITDSSTGVTTYTFSSTPIANNITIISANCVVNYKQIYFWVGTDVFYMYDGIARPLTNTFNARWFFDNVNLQFANKIFGVAIPEYDEIWWYAPMFGSAENNWAIVYNVGGNYWYDTPSNRASGIKTTSFPKPLFADSQPTPINISRHVTNNYLVWEHETGTDQTIAAQSSPIVKSITHHFIDICSTEENRLIRNRRLEPDFQMTGNMTVTFTNLMYAADYYNGDAIIEGPYIFNRNTQYIDTDSQGRFVSITFTSNELGGSFQGGKTLYDWNAGDVQT
jgi:hypothetical protein